jgi:RNA polymerase-binding transcription factor DksA
VDDFIKDHYSFVIEIRNQDEEFKLIRSDKTGIAEAAGVCEKCGEQHRLS